MESLTDLKKKYNALLVRNSKAENYLKTHTWLQYETPIKNKDGTYKTKDDGNGNPMYISARTEFDELMVNLSTTKKDIEALLYRNMTKDEVWNGFKV
jgi:hypothetical protein